MSEFSVRVILCRIVSLILLSTFLFAFGTAVAKPAIASIGTLSGPITRSKSRTPRPTPTATHTATATPAATPTPTPAFCLNIVSPAAGSTVSGTAIGISTIDTCSGNWFESLYVDGSHLADFATGKVVFDSTSVTNSTHIITVTSQSTNPNSVQFAKAVIALNVQNSLATPTPAPSPTPIPSPAPTPVAFFAVKPTGIA